MQNQLVLVLWFILLLAKVFLGSQIGFQLKVLLLLLPKCWNCRCIHHPWLGFVCDLRLLKIETCFVTQDSLELKILPQPPECQVTGFIPQNHRILPLKQNQKTQAVEMAQLVHPPPNLMT